MSSKVKGSRGRSSTSSKYDAQEKRIYELESLLAERDAVILDLHKKLAEQGESHSLSNMKLRKDRDELRAKNAALVGKLAEVSRKQSTNIAPSVFPSTLHRSSTSRLPSIPSPSHSPKDQPQQLHHHSNNGTPPSIKTSAGPISSTTQKTISFARQAATQDSDTDYSDLEEDVVVVETSTKKDMSTNKKSPSIEEVMDQEMEKELAAVLHTVASSSSPVLVGYKKKIEEQKLRQPSFSPSSPSTGPARQRQSSSTSSSSTTSSEGREASYSINAAQKTSPPQQKTSPPQQKVHAQQLQAIKKYSSSHKVASVIHEMLGKRVSVEEVEIVSKERSSSDPKVDILLANGSSSTVIDAPGIVAVRNGDVKLRSNSDCTVKSTTKSDPILTKSYPIPTKSDPIPTVPRTEKGGVAKTRAMFEKMSSNPSMDPPPFSYGDRTDSASSDVFSSEGTGTDLESSLDTTSVSLPPTKSDISPSHVTNSLQSMPNLLDRKRDLSKLSKSLHGSKFMDDSNIDEEDEGEDELGDMQSFGKVDMRSRTKTLSGVPFKGKSKVEIGRKRMKEHRKENLIMKRATSMAAQKKIAENDIAKDRHTMKMELELLSPLLAAKIKNMSLKRIYNTYGGRDVVTRAVAVIEQAWLNYRLRKRFLQRLNEKRENRAMQRKRAKSLRQPHRKPSILGARRKYRNVGASRGAVVASKEAVDPMARTKEKADRLAMERPAHSHSGARSELMEKRRSDVSLTKSLDGNKLEEEEEEEVWVTVEVEKEEEEKVVEEEEEKVVEEVAEKRRKHKLVSDPVTCFMWHTCVHV